MNIVCSLADLTAGKSQGAAAVDKSVVKEWFSALGGSEGINNRLMVRENVAQNAVACIDDESISGEDCLVVVVRLLANAHLPPKELQPRVREWFTRGPGCSLFIQLQNDNSFGAMAFVENIQALSSVVV